MGNIPTNNLENIHKLTESEAVTQMGSSAAGLATAQANTNQETYGKNVISNKKGKPTILVFLENFVSLMAILLWVGGAIALIAKMPELAVAIWLVNVINGVFSFWQEHRASKATEALKKMLPTYARVIRDGQEQQISAEDLVPGDIMLIEEGDKISADARLLETSDLQVNQSTLTGESNPVRKTHASGTSRSTVVWLPSGAMQTTRIVIYFTPQILSFVRQLKGQFALATRLIAVTDEASSEVCPAEKVILLRANALRPML